MPAEPSTDRVRVRRGAIRAEYDRDAILEVLDAGLIAHVGVVTDDGPIVLPMAYGRDDDWLYLHGSVANAALRAAVGQDICVTVTILDGLVVGRCPFHNSMNYRGVVVRGTARRVDDPDEHMAALRLVSDHVVATWDTGPGAVGRRDPQDDGDRRPAGRDVGEDPRRRPGRRARGPRRAALGGSRADPLRLGGARRTPPTCRAASPSRRRSLAWRAVTRRNRVDPWGDLHAVAAQRPARPATAAASSTTSGAVVRHHRSTTLWITCVTEFRDHRQPLADPHRWTPIFFLDEAVALAAGHRPCAYCRRADYHAYRDAIDDGPRSAVELDRRLASERLRRGTRPVPRRRPATAAGARRVVARRHGRRRRRPAAVPADRRDAAPLHVRRLVTGDALAAGRRRAHAADVGRRAHRRLPAAPAPNGRAMSPALPGGQS